MKRPAIIRASLMAVCGLAASSWLQATDKANNADALNLGSSWGGTAPGQFDFARWTVAVSAVNASSAPLGGNVTWGGIQIVGPQGPVTIAGANTLTLNNLGIDMASATQDLTISSGLTLMSGANQTWNVASGRVLTINGTFSRSAGSTLNFQGAGTVSTTTMGLTSGILGSWATIGSSTSTRYATVSGGNVTAYTGTAAATAANVTDTTGAVNYELAAGGAFGAGANFNTLRYSGGNDTTTGAIQTNGILNVGGTLAIGGAVTIGAGKDLVINTLSAMTLSGGIVNNSGGASGLTKIGAGTLTLTTASAYTGQTTINGGVLDIGNMSNLGSGALVINNGAILQGNGTFTRSFSGTSTPGAGQLASFNGGFAAKGGNLTLTFANNSATEFAFNTSAYVFGSNLILGSATADSKVIITNVINLNSSLSNRLVTVDAGNGNASAEFSNLVKENAGAFSGITKAGSGLLLLSNGTNSYTGSTLIQAGTISVSVLANSNVVSGIGASTAANEATRLVFGGVAASTGTLQYTGATVSTNRNFTITSGTTGVIEVTNAATNLTWSGSAASSTGALTKAGAGTLTLTGTNLNTGLTSITGGVLDVGTISGGALGTGGVFLSGGGVLQGNGTITRGLSGNVTPGTNQISGADGGFAAKGGTLTINLSGGDISLNGSGFIFGNNWVFGSSTADSQVIVMNNVVLNTGSQRSITVKSGAGGDSVDFRGVLKDGVTPFAPSGFAKFGTGLMILSNTNTYTGATGINAGTLQVGIGGVGSIHASSAVTLSGSGAVLAGSGSVFGAINVNTGTIKPGDSGGASTGTLNTGSITFAPTGSMIVAELQITGSTGTSNLASDKIISSGAISFSVSANNNIFVNGTGYTATLGDTFTLLDWTGTLTQGGFSLGTDFRTGKNSDGNEGNLDLPDISALGYAWDIAFSNFTSGGDLTFSVVAGAVPEPSRAVLLMAGMAVALMRRRRRA